MTINVSKIEVRSFAALTMLLSAIGAYGYSIVDVSKDKVVLEVPSELHAYSNEVISTEDNKLKMAIMALSSPEDREEVKKEIDSLNEFNKNTVDISKNRSKQLKRIMDVCTKYECNI